MQQFLSHATCPPGRGDFPPLLQPNKYQLVLDLMIQAGCKAELI